MLLRDEMEDAEHVLESLLNKDENAGFLNELLISLVAKANAAAVVVRPASLRNAMPMHAMSAILAEFLCIVLNTVR